MLIAAFAIPSALLILAGVGMSHAAAAGDRASEDSFRGLMLRAFGRRKGDRRKGRERRAEQQPVEQERRVEEHRVGERRSDPLSFDR
jgi:hypothetical protein